MKTSTGLSAVLIALGGGVLIASLPVVATHGLATEKVSLAMEHLVPELEFPQQAIDRLPTALEKGQLPSTVDIDSTRLLGTTPEASFYAATDTGNNQVCLVAVFDLPDHPSIVGCTEPHLFHKHGIAMRAVAADIQQVEHVASAYFLPGDVRAETAKTAPGFSKRPEAARALQNNLVIFNEVGRGKGATVRLERANDSAAFVLDSRHLIYSE